MLFNAVSNCMLQAKIRHHREQIHVQSVHDSGNPQFQPQRHRDLQLRLYQLIRKSWRDFETLWWVSVGCSSTGELSPPTWSSMHARQPEKYTYVFLLPNSLNSMFALNLHGIKLTWILLLLSLQIKFSKSSPALRFSANLSAARRDRKTRTEKKMLEIISCFVQSTDWMNMAQHWRWSNSYVSRVSRLIHFPSAAAERRVCAMYVLHKIIHQTASC